MKSTKLNIK